MKRLIGGLTLAALLSIGFAATAGATKPAPDHKVTICHRTDSNTNPYVRITVDIASSGYLKEGHDSHNGPVWDPTLKAQHIKWGDIIPPYTYGTFTYPGKNWTEAGIAIYQNGCAIPGEPAPSESPSATPSEEPSMSPTPSPSETPGQPSMSPSESPSLTPAPSETPMPTGSPVDTGGGPTPPPTDTGAVAVSAPMDWTVIVLIAVGFLSLGVLLRPRSR